MSSIGEAEIYCGFSVQGNIRQLLLLFLKKTIKLIVDMEVY